MLTEISENRWIEQPEIIYRETFPFCQAPVTGSLCMFRHTDFKHDHEFSAPESYIARMPSGSLWQLTKEEVEKLLRNNAESSS